MGKQGRFGVLFCVPMHSPVLPVNDALLHKKVRHL